MSQELLKKGKTMQAIGMALGGLAGAAAGFFTNSAISMSVNNNYVSKASGGEVKTYADVKNGKTGWGEQVGYSVVNGNVTIDYENNFTDGQLKHMKTTDIAGKVGGAFAGAAVGVALGSLFGKSKIEAAEAGISSASNLTSIANDTKSVANKVAETRGFAVNATSVASDDAIKLENTATKVSKDVAKTGNMKAADSNSTATAAKQASDSAPEISSANPEDEEAKKTVV